MLDEFRLPSRQPRGSVAFRQEGGGCVEPRRPIRPLVRRVGVAGPPSAGWQLGDVSECAAPRPSGRLPGRRACWPEGDDVVCRPRRVRRRRQGQLPPLYGGRGTACSTTRADFV